MRYSIEPRDRIYVKRQGFLPFAKNMGRHANKVAANLTNKYSQKLLDSAKKSTTDAIKTTSKRATQNTEEATGDLISNKIADKVTNTAKKSTKELPKNETEEDSELGTPKKRYISPEERQQIIDELRLVTKTDAYFQKLQIHRKQVKVSTIV